MKPYSPFFIGTTAFGVAAVLGCSGDTSEQELTIEEYFQTIGPQFEAAQSPTAWRERLEDVPITNSRELLDLYADLLTDFQTALEDVRPPREVELAHQEAIQANQVALDTLNSLISRTGGIDSIENELGDAVLFPPPGGSRRDACLSLQRAADVAHLNVELYCITHRQEGASMEPGIANGEYVTVREYGTTEPMRGDVILFTLSTSPDHDFAKRLIALPGDTVEVAQHVVLNGSRLEEPYVQGPTECTTTCEWVVPEAASQDSYRACGSSSCYFVLGDNRPNSSDSRQGWLVPLDNIIGKVRDAQSD